MKLAVFAHTGGVVVENAMPAPKVCRHVFDLNRGTSIFICLGSCSPCAKVNIAGGRKQTNKQTNTRQRLSYDENSFDLEALLKGFFSLQGFVTSLGTSESQMTAPTGQSP